MVMVQMRDNFVLEVPDRSWRMLPHIAPLEMIFKIAFELTSDCYLVWRSQFAKSSSSPYRHHHRHCHFIVAIFASTYQQLLYDTYHAPDNTYVNDHTQRVAKQNNVKYKIWQHQEAIFLKNVKRINE